MTHQLTAKVASAVCCSLLFSEQGKLFESSQSFRSGLADMQTCMHGRLGARAETTASTNSNFLSGRSVPVLRSRQRTCTQQQKCRHSLQVQARSLEAGMGLFGTKAGMTQIFTPEGLATGGTVIAFDSGNKVTQLKTAERDGYNAVQIGYQEVAERKIPKPEVGHLKKSGLPAYRNLREYKVHIHVDVAGVIFACEQCTASWM